MIKFSRSAKHFCTYSVIKDKAARDTANFIGFTSAGITSVNGRLEITKVLRSEPLIFTSKLTSASFVFRKLVSCSVLGAFLFYLSQVATFTAILRGPLLIITGYIFYRKIVDEKLKVTRNIKKIEFGKEASFVLYPFLGRPITIERSEELYVLFDRNGREENETNIGIGYQGKLYNVPMRSCEINNKAVFNTLLRGYRFVSRE